VLNVIDRYNNKKLLQALILSAMMGCESAEEQASRHLEKGKDLLAKGNYDQAILELKSSNQANDKRGETYYYMALLDEKNKNFKSMKENLIKVVELEPDNLEAIKKLSKLHLLFGEFDKALKQAEYLLEKNAADEEANLLKASAYVKTGKKVEALTLIDKVLQGNQKSIDALSLKSALKYEEGNVDQALSLVDNALSVEEKNIPLRIFKIKINAKNNNISGVIDDYKKLIELYPDVDNFKLSLASIYAMQDKVDLAEGLLRSMLANQPQKVEPKLILLEFINAKNKSRLESEFYSLLDSSKENPQTILELSKWMLANGNLEQAKKGLQIVIDGKNNGKAALSAMAILADLELSKQDYVSAEKNIENILLEDPDFLEANLLKAKFFLLKKEPDKAIELLNKLTWSKNDSDAAFTLMGQAYQFKKDRKQADQNFKRALELNPANMQAFAPVYNGYLQANQFENARLYLDKALKSKPNQSVFLTNKAELDIQEKKWDDAQDAVQKLGLFSKNKAIPLYLQANILQGKSNYKAAIELYQKLLSDYPGHVNSMVNLVKCYEALKQTDQAIVFLESHYNKNRSNLATVGVLADLYAANNNLNKAKQLLLLQLKETPDKSASVYLALAKVEAALQKDVESAKQVYIKGLEENPGDLQLSMALAGLYEQTGKIHEAIQLYRNIVDKNPDTLLAINNLAALLLESSNDSDLAMGLQLGEKLKDFDNVYFQDTYAWSLIKNGRNKEGLTILESLIVRAPKIPDMHYHLAIAQLNAGNKATAIIELKQAISLADKYKTGFAIKNQALKFLSELKN